MALDIHFTSAPLGHEIAGVDLRKLDDDTFAQIEKTFDTYGSIVIRGQSLTPQ